MLTVLVTAGRSQAPAPAGADREGLFITVPNPITDSAVNQIKRRVEEAMRKRRRADATFSLVFDFNPRGLPSGTSTFGACHDLAEFIRKLRLGVLYPNIKTYAFVHNEVSRHTVLPVLACGELEMSAEIDPNTQKTRARIGDVLRDAEGPPSSTVRKAYETVAESFTKGLVFRMIDRTLVVRKVKTVRGNRYLSAEEIELSKQAGEKPEPDEEVPPGLEVGNTMYDAIQARDYGLCKAFYNSRAELARALRLSPRSLREERADQTPVVWRVEVRGTLDRGRLESLRHRLKRAVRRNATLIILHLDCEAGDTVDADSMAEELSTLTDDAGTLPVRTIAYVPPGRSLGAATFLALGCSEIVMGKDAYLGDFNYLPDRSPDALKPRREMLVKRAGTQGYPGLLFQATLDPALVLYRAQSRTDPSDYELVTEDDLLRDERSEKPRWNRAGRIDKPEGQFLKIDGKLAKEWGVVYHNDVDTPEALYALYGIEQRVRVAPDDWREKVAEFFQLPAVNVVLIMLGIIGLILELKVPGATFPGVLAALCFVLYFWANSYRGEYAVLAVLLFLLGLILLGIEVFVLPGFGVTGISGILLVVAGLVLGTMEKMPETTQDWVRLAGTMATFGAALVGAIAGAFVLAWYLPHIPYANRLVLKPPAEQVTETEGPHSEASPLAALLGAIGVAATDLRPAGKARFGDDFHDVIAEGDFVNAGSRVQVIEIEGNRIVVKEML
jgi:membrane-bound ClpP family serine protease